MSTTFRVDSTDGFMGGILHCYDLGKSLTRACPKEIPSFRSVFTLNELTLKWPVQPPDSGADGPEDTSVHGLQINWQWGR